MPPPAEWVAAPKHVLPAESALHRTDVTLGSTPQALRRSAVLVIDVQRHCSLPDTGCWAGVARDEQQYFFDRVDVMTANIARVLAAARANGQTERVFTVIESLTQDGRDLSVDYKLTRNGETGACRLLVPKGSDGAQVLPAVAPIASLNEIVLPKTSCSVFQSTNVDYVLRNMDVRHLVVTGQLTNQCVESAVRDAADLGYYVTVVPDACAALSAAEHDAGLHNMRGFARIVSTDDIVRELQGQSPPPATPEATPQATASARPATPAPAPLAVSAEERRGYAAAIRTALLAAGVRWLRFVTTDMSNRPRSKALNLREESLRRSPERLLEGVGFFGGLNAMCNYAVAIAEGTGCGPERIDRCVGDFSTLTVLPYSPAHAFVYGSLVGPSGQTAPLCPRGFLLRQVQRAAAQGVYLSCGVELEFYLLRKGEGATTPCDGAKNLCFASNRSLDTEAGAFLDEVAEALEKQPACCAGVEQGHREGGAGQYELVLRYVDCPVRLADSIVTARETLHAVADKHGFVVSLLPKTLEHDLGSGMHIHMSVRRERDGPNCLPASACDDDGHGFSAFGASFMAGIVADLHALVGATMAHTNSYRRMQPGYWTGSRQNWAFDDKEAAVRVCRDATQGVPYHFEVKTADCTMNPYVALGLLLTSGVRGVTGRMKLCPPLADDAPLLPSTFAKALSCFKDVFLADTAPPGFDAELYEENRRALFVYHCVKTSEEKQTSAMSFQEEVTKYLDFY